jgi:hypothetical protein
MENPPPRRRENAEFRGGFYSTLCFSAKTLRLYSEISVGVSEFMLLYHFAIFASLPSHSLRLRKCFNRKGRKGFRKELKIVIKQFQNQRHKF